MSLFDSFPKFNVLVPVSYCTPRMPHGLKSEVLIICQFVEDSTYNMISWIRQS